MYSCSFMHATVLLLSIISVSAKDPPEVTLNHGGVLRGQRSTWLGKDVDIYSGVRYAKAPVGELRFKKPAEYPSWSGVEEATEFGQMCPQLMGDSLAGPLEQSGTEDCLFLDVTVPGGTTAGDKKPVMVFIHGGGYGTGSRSIYLGAPLAVHGDVIMVTVNYRLGILGFLGDEFGGANFGLWDQRAALVWVQKNIAAFGGDPDMVTIFGQSAGGGSVSAQTMGKHNDGLFKRAITQSSSLYMMFDLSVNGRQKIIRHFREKSGCTDDVKSVYECLRDTPINEIINMTLTDAYLAPMSDNDFFPDSVNKEIYDLAHRFDLMAGVNGGEGGLRYALEIGMVAAMTNKSHMDGVDAELLQAYLHFKCNMYTPLSAELCVSHLMKLYEFDTAKCDKERARKVYALAGESMFNVDTVSQLEQHATSDKSTYGYYFTECYKPDPPNMLWQVPDWLKTSADHADELGFLFGASFIKTGKEQGELWMKILMSDPVIRTVMFGDIENRPDKEQELAYEPLALRMMTVWTNFARSGNPNVPMELDTPEWPEFGVQDGKFMELKLDGSQVIDTPHRARLHSFKHHVSSARRRQLDVDRPSSGKGGQAKADRHDEL